MISHDRRRLSVAVLLLGSLLIQGCQDWPDERVTAIEAQNILRDLSRIEEVPDANNPLPDIYKSPPKKLKQIVGGAEEWKLVYYCQYHTADKLQKLVDEQFSSQIFDAQGKSKTVPNFGVSASSETNQLIIRCLTEQDADAILAVIEEMDVPPIQVRIDCMVSEIYSDLTMDRETSLEIENLFGEGVNLSGPKDASGNLLPAFPGASIRDATRGTFGLNVGVSVGDPGHRFEALVDILVSRGYLKILMNPTLQVVNGQTAKIESRQHLPLQQITYDYLNSTNDVLKSETEYYDINDSLEITPHVYGDGTIGIETTVQLASHLTPEGIDQTPIVTERTITIAENRIRHGESLIIGGIRKTEKRDVIRGVPILKDIPVLNLLFSGRDFEERATETIFILTPTISVGGQPNKDVVQMLRERHRSPMTQGLHEQLFDPLALRAREEEGDREVEAARKGQQRSETERDAARLEIIETGQQIDDLSAELKEVKSQAQEASIRAEKADSKAGAAEARAQRAATEAQKAKEEAQKARADADAAKKKAAESDNKQSQEPAKPKEQAQADPNE
jgi:Bacterial type II and III secretion system protein